MYTGEAYAMRSRTGAHNLHVGMGSWNGTYTIGTWKYNNMGQRLETVIKKRTTARDSKQASAQQLKTLQENK